MNDALMSDFTFVKSLFSSFKAESNLVLVPSSYVQIMEQKWPDLNIQGYSRNDAFDIMAKKVASSRVFIGDHLSNLVFAIFLSPKSTVIDLSPPKYSCNRWIEEYPVDAKVISFFDD